MSLVETLFFVLFSWNVVGFIVFISLFTCVDYFNLADDFRVLNPIYIYKKIRVNWFGAACLTLVFNLICPVVSLGYWFYKLCTVGRK